jgi:NAD-dependent SIR2 family protein deacetylase
MTPTAHELTRRRIETQVAETLAQTFGLLKPLKPTDRYVGHNRYWLFRCSGCDRQVTRPLSDVKRSYRNHKSRGSSPPACASCQTKATAKKRLEAMAKRASEPVPEKMGKRCMWCGDMPWQRKGGICKGCERPYAAEAAPVRGSLREGNWSWL